MQQEIIEATSDVDMGLTHEESYLCLAFNGIHGTKMRFTKDAPLNPADNLEQTHGCRHFNPDLCKNMNLQNVCAFVRTDELCVKPPNSWKKIYQNLKDAS